MSFKDMKYNYKNVVIIGNEIPVESFLDASESLVSILESLGSAFSPVKSDIQGNINKLRKYYSQDNNCKTLESIVLKEHADKKKKIATEALLWLKRALEFTSKGLRLNFGDESQELSASFSKAYESTLSAHHSFLVRPVFSLAMKACPKRLDFYNKLSLGMENDEFKREFSEWLEALERLVKMIVEFYQKGDFS